MLWNRSLVMKDLETGTLWSHILGEAMRGELEGEKLKLLPSVITSWQDWKSDHPDTSVLALKRTSRTFVAEFQKNSSKFVLGVGGVGGAVAFPFGVLAERKVVNDRLGSEKLVACFYPETTEAHCFARDLDDEELAVETGDRAGEMRDKQTGSIWDAESGRCLRGPHKGRQLKEIPAIVSFRRAWFVFHPDSREYGR